MPSAALSALLTAISEVSDLTLTASAIGTSTTGARRIRATGRAQTVLLSSHFERYFYAVNEEAVSFLNANNVAATALPLSFRLLHTKEPLDITGETAWENRGNQLSDLISTDGWLWNTSLDGGLLHARLLGWMSAPKPKNLVRYYRYWEIDDIFATITRTKQTRNLLWLGVQELVDRRNSIAHGDYAAQATSSDITRFKKSVSTFCTRADGALARAVSKILKGSRPW